MIKPVMIAESGFNVARRRERTRATRAASSSAIVSRRQACGCLCVISTRFLCVSASLWPNYDLRLHLRREDAGDGFADFGAVDAVEGQRELCFHQAVRNAGVEALAVGLDEPVLVGLLA